MTEAQTFLLSHKAAFFWTILTSGEGTHISSRAVFLQHNEKAGFFIITKNNSRKTVQCAKNPHVTLSLAVKDSYNNIVAHASVRVSDKREDIDLGWNDSYKQYGYTGPEDPTARILLFTVHSLVFGEKVYAGVAQDPKTFDIDRTAPFPALPEGPFQTAEALALLKATIAKEDIFHLITWNSLQHDDRMMKTIYSDELGLFQCTKVGRKKIQQIEANPNVSLLLERKETNGQIVVDAVCWVETGAEVKAKAWRDWMKGPGYTGPEDPTLAVLRFAVRHVEVHVITSNQPTILRCDPPKFDRDSQILARAAKTNHHCYLTTVDKEGVPHSRMMGMIMFHPTLGFTMSTQRGAKAEHLDANKHATITMFDEKTTDEYVFECVCTMQGNAMTRYAKWMEMMRGVGYTGPDDEKSLTITIAVTKAVMRNVGAFYAAMQASM